MTGGRQSSSTPLQWLMLPRPAQLGPGRDDNADFMDVFDRMPMPS